MPSRCRNDFIDDRDKDVGFIVFDTIRRTFVASMLLVMNVNNEVVTLGANNRDRRYKRNTVDTDVDDKDVVLRRLYCYSLPFSSCCDVLAITNVDD